MTDARAVMDAATDESALLDAVLKEAALRHWRVAHFYDSRRSKSRGWPDLVLCRGNTLLLVELKREGHYPRKDQREWLEALATVRVVKTAVWRPRDRDRITEELR